MESGPKRTSRVNRWALRDTLRSFTTLRRLKACGRSFKGDCVEVRRRDETGHYYGNVQTCASIWACPSCQARIRQRRGVELDKAMRAHIAGGGKILFATLTVPHFAQQSLKTTFEGVAGAWRRMQQQKEWKSLRGSFVGFVRATEVTHGSNGWHPHLHVVVFLKADAHWAYVSERIFEQWGIAVHREGLGVVSSKGQRFELAKEIPELAAYMVKSTLGSTLALELTRADLKTGHEGGLAPMQLLALAIGKAESDDWTSEEARLWEEFEKVTKGRRAIEWSRGLKASFAVVEVSDDEIVTETLDGEIVLRIERKVWSTLVLVPGATALLLDRLDRLWRIANGVDPADLAA